jgi:hypothetical protein
VHSDTSLTPELKLKIKLELFCCHLINRIFETKHIEVNFATYKKRLEHKGFLRWIEEQNREILEKTINYLNNKYMSGK